VRASIGLLAATSLLALAAALGPAAVAAPGDEPQAVPASHDFLLDEYNVDVSGSSNAARVAAGLTFGNGYENGWWWNAGARVSWLRWQVDVPTEKGFGLGGLFGGGWRPDEVVSPYGQLALDRAFSLGGVADWIATVSAGARVRVTPDPREHFAMTFALVRTQGFGGDGPGGGEFGLAVFYSAVLQAPKR
jgi:hypothetical protein